MTVKGRGWRRTTTAILGATLFAVISCEPATGPEVDPPFAFVGEMRVDVQQPIAGEQGGVSAILLWQSDGRWALSEGISYRGAGGEEVVQVSRGNPGDLAAEYRSLVQQLNLSQGLRLIDTVDPTLNPLCSPPRSRVSVTLADRFRGQVLQWTRCADGSLFTMTPAGAGPDPGAARVITAAQLIRFFTLGEKASSVFIGSLPFSTLALRSDSRTRVAQSRLFQSTNGEPPADWKSFWEAEFGAETPVPSIDWDRDIVLLATAGMKREAGHAIRIRRILPLANLTQIEWVDEIPGDFCSPARRERYPFHLVLAPKPPSPIQFAEPIAMRVPCG